MLDVLAHGIGSTDAILTTNRVALGLFFLSSGYHKLFIPDVREKFGGLVKRLGLPPQLQPVIAGGELLGGLGLLFGALAVPAALGLMAILMGAWCMTCIPNIRAKQPRDVLDWISKSMMEPETLLFLMLTYVVKAGAGPWSIDALALRIWG